MSAITIAYVRYHWDEVYAITVTNRTYSARANFGEHDLLEAKTPEALLSLIRHYYPGSTSADLCST
jgi:hypothetical protein